MSYSVKLDKKAENFLYRLPKEISLRIINKFEEVAKNPFRYLEHYEGKGYKLRVGIYRALIDVEFKRKILFVRILDKRGKIYKN